MSRQESRLPPPSHKAILSYWVEHGSESVIGWETVDNIGECSLGHSFCWSCGVEVSSLNRLQKCHIHPHSLGGSNDVSNYFLMCGSCHEQSPDTSIPEIFFRWVSNKESYLEQLMLDITSETKDLLPSINNDNAVGELLVSKYKESKITSHGGSISRSSSLGMVRYLLENIIEEAV